MLENQPTNMPTRKSMVTALGGTVALPFVLPMIEELYGQLAPAILQGPATAAFLTTLLAGLISAVVGGMGPAWWVRDRWGSPALDQP